MMMFPSVAGRSPLFALAVSAGAVIIFIFGFMAWQSPSRIPQAFHGHYETPVHAETSHLSINDILRILYAPLKAKPTEPFIREPNGSHIELPPNPRWKKNLGKDVLILDLETRDLPSAEAYEKGEFDWRNLNHVSGGVFNHYAYAQIHGYDYKFIHAQNFEDRHATWIKPSALANHIKKYKFIIFMDADAAFRFLHVPIEWLLNYWDITQKDAITMAKDPWTQEEPEFNSDRFNRTYTNTGFMIVQNTDQTMPILKAWHECPDDTRYQNCSQWKTPKFHEQSAFGEYIRYDYGDYIKELDCGQANGFPGVEISNCQGKFIRHYWFEKHLVKVDFRENIMNAITMPIQKLFNENRDESIITKTEENVIH